MELGDIIENLLSFITYKEELRDSMQNINDCVNKTFQLCFEEYIIGSSKKTANRNLDIESILDYLHDELNTGHWSEVPVEIRRAFTAASYSKTIIMLKNSRSYNENLNIDCLKSLDMGLLLGAPLKDNYELLTKCARFLSKQFYTTLNKDSKHDLKISREKRKLSQDYMHIFINLKGIDVDILSCPSIETFNRTYFTKQQAVKLQDCMKHWPAVTKWTDLNYLLKIAGDRTVPIEIGSHYADENWCQKLMPLKEFIKNYFLGDSDNVGYLAQHNLFDQIPELKNDIYIPEYCCLGESEDDPDINAWFGPGNTVSPLHYDPKNNILVQIFGTKRLILFSPTDSPYLYPHEGMLLSNTAQVDPVNPDLEKFPDFNKATAYKCLLEPGEMLYIPPKWWHHVTALDKSFSVSFWWNS